MEIVPVGSMCIENIDSKVGVAIAYFKHILHRAIQGEYKGQDSHGLQRFSQVKLYTSTTTTRGETFKPTSHKKLGREMASLSQTPQARDFD